MSNTDVNIVLRATDSGAERVIRGTSRATEELGRAAQTASRQTSGLRRALNDALGHSARSTLSDIRGLTNAAVGLGGALGAMAGGAGLAQLVQESISVRDQFARLQIESQSAGVTIGTAMAAARASAERFGVPVHDIAEGLQVWQDRFANLRTGVDSMRDLVEFSRASGDSMANVVGVAGELNRQLGIPAERMGEALAVMRAQGQQGSVTFQQISQRVAPLMAIIGAGFRRTGIQGMREITAITQRVATKQPDVAMATTQVHAMLSAFLNPRTQREMRSAGVRFKDAQGAMLPPLEIIQNVLDRTGGDLSRIGRVFHQDEARSAFLAFIEDWQQNGHRVMGGGSATEQLVNAQGSVADTARDAAAAAETTAARLQRLRERLANLVDSRLLNAVERLVGGLDGAITAVTYAVDHPVTAGAGLLGGRLLMGMIPSLAGAGFSAMGRAMFGGAGGAASSVAGAVVQSTGAQRVFVTNWPAGGVGGGGGLGGAAAEGAAGEAAGAASSALVTGRALTSMNVGAAFAANPMGAASFVIASAAIGITAGTIISENWVQPALDRQQQRDRDHPDDIEVEGANARANYRLRQLQAERAAQGTQHFQRQVAAERREAGWGSTGTGDEGAANALASRAGLDRLRQIETQGRTQERDRMRSRAQVLEEAIRGQRGRTGPLRAPEQQMQAWRTELAQLRQTLAHFRIEVVDSTRSGVNARVQGRRHGANSGGRR